MFFLKNRIFRLCVGDHVIGLRLPSADYIKFFEEYFRVKSSKKKHDLLINLTFIEHDDEIDVPHSLFIYKETNGDKVYFGENIAYGSYSDSDRTGELTVKYGLMEIPLIRVFEQILYQAFYNAVKIKQTTEILVHSSGVIYKGMGFIFVGSSGSGKSTTARLSEDFTVLNDEICLITKKGGEYFLSYTPFNGLYYGKKNGSAPLAAVILLAHGKSNRFVEISRPDAVKTLAKEIAPAIGLTDKLYTGQFAELLDYSSDIMDSVPVKKMEFLPDKSFWQLIDDEFFR